MRVDDLSRLVDMESPEGVFAEVGEILAMVYPGPGFQRLGRVYDDIVKLFSGKFWGYRKCNTEYHDLQHTTDVLLCTARLLHGMHVAGRGMSRETTELCLISALMHDTGFIQGYDDYGGTGAKYITVHVERSLIFMKSYFLDHGFTPGEYDTCERLVSATDLNADFRDIQFASEEEATAGRALFAGDMLGQMADRLYLEKLLFLYLEFREAGVMESGKEDELLENTLGFYERARRKLGDDAGYSAEYMKNHFRERWGIDRDMYLEAVEKNIEYLKYILEDRRKNYRERLMRAGIVKKVKEKEKKKKGGA